MIIEYLSDNREMIPEIAENFYQEWGYLRPESSVFRYILKLNERKNNNKIPLSLVAKTNRGKFLGTASLVENDMDTFHEFSPWLSGVFVVNDQRNKGICRELLNKMESVALELGFKNLHLFTFDKVDFYSKLGWSVDKTDCYLNHDVTIMCKELQHG